MKKLTKKNKRTKKRNIKKNNYSKKKNNYSKRKNNYSKKKNRRTKQKINKKKNNYSKKKNKRTKQNKKKKILKGGAGAAARTQAYLEGNAPWLGRSEDDSAMAPPVIGGGGAVKEMTPLQAYQTFATNELEERKAKLKEREERALSLSPSQAKDKELMEIRLDKIDIAAEKENNRYWFDRYRWLDAEVSRAENASHRIKMMKELGLPPALPAPAAPAAANSTVELPAAAGDESAYWDSVFGTPSGREQRQQEILAGRERERGESIKTTEELRHDDPDAAAAKSTVELPDSDAGPLVVPGADEMQREWPGLGTFSDTGSADPLHGTRGAPEETHPERQGLVHEGLGFVEPDEHGSYPIHEEEAARMQERASMKARSGTHTRPSHGAFKATTTTTGPTDGRRPPVRQGGIRPSHKQMKVAPEEEHEALRFQQIRDERDRLLEEYNKEREQKKLGPVVRIGQNPPSLLHPLIFMEKTQQWQTHVPEWIKKLKGPVRSFGPYRTHSGCAHLFDMKPPSRETLEEAAQKNKTVAPGGAQGPSYQNIQKEVLTWSIPFLLHFLAVAPEWLKTMLSNSEHEIHICKKYIRDRYKAFESIFQADTDSGEMEIRDEEKTMFIWQIHVYMRLRCWTDELFNRALILYNMHQSFYSLDFIMDLLISCEMENGFLDSELINRYLTDFKGDNPNPSFSTEKGWTSYNFRKLMDIPGTEGQRLSAFIGYPVPEGGAGAGAAARSAASLWRTGDESQLERYSLLGICKQYLVNVPKEGVYADPGRFHDMREDPNERAKLETEISDLRKERDALLEAAEAVSKSVTGNERRRENINLTFARGVEKISHDFLITKPREFDWSSSDPFREVMISDYVYPKKTAYTGSSIDVKTVRGNFAYTVECYPERYEDILRPRYNLIKLIQGPDLGAGLGGEPVLKVMPEMLDGPDMLPPPVETGGPPDGAVSEGDAPAEGEPLGGAVSEEEEEASETLTSEMLEASVEPLTPAMDRAISIFLKQHSEPHAEAVGPGRGSTVQYRVPRLKWPAQEPDAEAVEPDAEAVEPDAEAVEPDAEGVE